MAWNIGFWGDTGGYLGYKKFNTHKLLIILGSFFFFMGLMVTYIIFLFFFPVEILVKKTICFIIQKNKTYNLHPKLHLIDRIINTIIDKKYCVNNNEYKNYLWPFDILDFLKYSMKITFK